MNTDLWNKPNGRLFGKLLEPSQNLDYSQQGKNAIIFFTVQYSECVWCTMCNGLTIYVNNWSASCRAGSIVMTLAFTAPCWLKYHMEWHMALGPELTWRSACLPGQGKTSGQSHFQQINLILKFTSFSNLKQSQVPASIHVFLPHPPPYFLYFSRTKSTTKWEGKGRDRGMDECEKRRRERKRYEGRKAGNYFQRSFC